MFTVFSFTRLQIFAVWFVITYGAVALAMVIDGFSGVRKARQAGKATRSRLFRMSCDKAIKYFLPMMCLTLLDLITSVILPAPFFTMAYAAFCIFCDWKSIFESTHDKEEIREAANTMNVVVKNKDDIAKVIKEVLDDMAKANRLEHHSRED